MADPVNDILISPASYWEIATKIRLGRYTLNVPYALFMQRAIGGTVRYPSHCTEAHSGIASNAALSSRSI
jgi:PIN domain nuclease of toxin-antitoxin system